MNFSKKVFISVFLSTLAVGALLTWGTYRYATDRQIESFVKQYKTTSELLGRALSRLDTQTENFMLNAAKVMAARDERKGLLSTDELKSLRDELNVTHLFVVDKKGNFIRSTNEDPKLIPNAYSFCSGYRNLVSGGSNIEATPIIHPSPEPKPYKFLFVPSKNRDRLLEVGVRVDFVAKTLTEALGADPSILSMALYSPVGTPFGRFSANHVEFNGDKVRLPEVFPHHMETEKEYRFFEKVTSSHPSCCQCDVSGTSRNGEYYYVLESVVSKKDLAAVKAATRNAFILVSLGGIFVALVFSRFVSRRLVRNIEKAAKKIHQINESGDLKDRIQIKGSRDEVAFITQEYDRLLDSLQESQRKIIETEIAQAKIQIAKEIAHNIKSPVIAMEVLLPTLNAPERIKKILKNSVTEIKALSDRLSNQSSAGGLSENSRRKFDSICLAETVSDVVSEREAAFSKSGDVTISLQIDDNIRSTKISADPIELRAVIANLINNAVESYDSGSRVVDVSVLDLGAEAALVIKDQGKGIPDTIRGQLGKEEITEGKPTGRGLGLFHAYRTVRNFGGRIEISSEAGAGTTVTAFFSNLIRLVHTSAQNEASTQDLRLRNINKISRKDPISGNSEPSTSREEMDANKFSAITSEIERASLPSDNGARALSEFGNIK